MPEQVTFCGEQFDVVEVMGAMPWMRYAKAARAGLDSESMEGLALIYDLLKASLVDEQWPRFEQLATDNRVDNDAMWQVMKDVLEVVAARPTSRPSDSSDGPAGTSPSSEADSFLRVIGRLEGRGRPDLALFVDQAREFQAS